MKQNEKELLLKDLCARLPYGVKAKYYGSAEECECCDTIEGIYPMDDEIVIGQYGLSVDRIRLYLFPLSSMTEEQKKEFLSVAGYERREEDCGRHTETFYYDMVGHENTLYPNCDAIDWLNAHYFDYRSLIEKGLAIDATGLNIY